MMRDAMILVTKWNDGGVNTASYAFPDELETLAQDVKGAANTIGVTSLEVILPAVGHV